MTRVLDRTTNTPEAWTKRAQQASTSWDAAMWSEHGQRIRFERALHHLRLQPGDRLLDFGCGTGAFSRFVPADVVYLGIDSAKGMVDRATREHSTRAFLYEIPPRVMFTHVCAIGVWNLADAKTAYKDIWRLWQRTTKMLVVSIHRDLIAPSDLADFTAMFELDCSYLSNDSMLILRR